MRTTVILMLLALLLAACPEDNDKLTCGPNSCQPGGTCIDDDNGAYCICDYMQGSGLTCIPYSCCCAYTGEGCIDDSCCLSGRCLKHPGDVEGYCTHTQCANDSECVNHAFDETNEMCCVEFDDNYSICLKITEGFACGDQTGTCGASCTGTLDSACAVDYPCLRSSDADPMAICTPPCETAADCANCEWSEDPSVFFDCLVIASGEKYCKISGDPGCASSMDCPQSDTCTIGVSGDRTHIFGECATYGALAPGSACNDNDDPGDLDFEERCSGLYCMGGMCSEVCAIDSDCPEDMSCLEFTPPEAGDSITVCVGDS